MSILSVASHAEDADVECFSDEVGQLDVTDGPRK